MYHPERGAPVRIASRRGTRSGGPWFEFGSPRLGRGRGGWGERVCTAVQAQVNSVLEQCMLPHRGHLPSETAPWTLAVSGGARIPGLPIRVQSSSHARVLKIVDLGIVGSALDSALGLHFGSTPWCCVPRNTFHYCYDDYFVLLALFVLVGWFCCDYVIRL